MKKVTKDYLKEHRVIAGVPTIVKFKSFNGDFAKFKARKGYYVVRWEHILKAFKIEEESSK